MLEILLVFSVNGAPTEVSDRVFVSYEECAEFVNTLAEQQVVNSDHGFKFLASDGVVFEGQCIDSKDWIIKQGV